MPEDRAAVPRVSGKRKSGGPQLTLTDRVRGEFSKALDLLDDAGTPYHELLAGVAALDPIKFGQTLAKFLPRETQVQVQSAAQMHLDAVKQLSEAQVLTIASDAARDITEEEDAEDLLEVEEPKRLSG
jgi:hypothetical protein